MYQNDVSGSRLGLGLESDEVNRFVLERIYQKYLDQNEGELNISASRDVLVILGYKGSGKSTLINYLANKELEVSKFGEIVLKDPDDETAMKIGNYMKAETLLPKLINVNGLSICDMPGFGEDREIAYRLLTARIFKSIIEGAKSVNILFVISFDNLTSGRGDTFKEVMSVAKQLIPYSNIEDMSSIIITKTEPNLNTNDIIEYLMIKGAGDLVKPWIQNKRISKFSKPSGKTIEENDKTYIIDLLLRTPSRTVSLVQTDVIFNLKDQSSFSKLYQEEFNDIFDKKVKNKYEERICDSNLQVVEVLKILKEKKKYFEEEFEVEVIGEVMKSKFISLVKPVTEKLYVIGYDEFIEKLKTYKNKFRKQIKNEIKILEQKELDRKLEEINLIKYELQMQYDKNIRMNSQVVAEFNNQIKLLEDNNNKLSEELKPLMEQVNKITNTPPSNTPIDKLIMGIKSKIQLEHINPKEAQLSSNLEKLKCVYIQKDKYIESGNL